MAASSPSGNIDQAFFSSFNLSCKIVGFEAFLGPVRVSPRKTSKNSCASHDFQSNQSFGNRIANIAFAQGSQNLQ